MSSSRNPTRARSASAGYYRIRPTTGRGPRYGIAISALFHGAIVAAALFSFRHDFDTPPDSNMVPVDLVTIADKTNVAAQAPPQPKMDKVEAPTPDAPVPPEPQMQEAEPAPVPPMPKFQVEKEKTPDVDKPADTKPQPKTEDDKPTRKQQEKTLNDILNSLTAPEKSVRSARTGTRVIKGAGAGTAMTANIADALKSQIYRCWSPPIGAPELSDLVVDFDVILNIDGTVASATSRSLFSANTYTRASAEAAQRAIYQCKPYRLPQDSYEVWHEINPLRFDPRALEQ